jgi:hypothetical protein
MHRTGMMSVCQEMKHFLNFYFKMALQSVSELSKELHITQQLGLAGCHPSLATNLGSIQSSLF